MPTLMPRKTKSKKSKVCIFSDCMSNYHNIFIALMYTSYSVVNQATLAWMKLSCSSSNWFTRQINISNLIKVLARTCRCNPFTESSDL
jgi:hypothetical protein